MYMYISLTRLGSYSSPRSSRFRAEVGCPVLRMSALEFASDTPVCVDSVGATPTLSLLIIIMAQGTRLKEDVGIAIIGGP